MTTSFGDGMRKAYWSGIRRRSAIFCLGGLFFFGDAKSKEIIVSLRALKDRLRYGPNFTDDKERAAQSYSDLAGIGAPSPDAYGNLFWRAGRHIYRLDKDRAHITRVSFDPQAYLRVIGVDVSYGDIDSSDSVDARIVFCKDGTACTLVTARVGNSSKCFLLSGDGDCSTWYALSLPGATGIIQPENRTDEGENSVDIFTFESYRHVRSGKIWISTLLMDSKSCKRIAEPVLLHSQSILPPLHSGGGTISSRSKNQLFVAFPILAKPQKATTQIFGALIELVPGASRIASSGIVANIGTAADDAHCVPEVVGLRSGGALVIFGDHNGQLLYSVRDRLSDDLFTRGLWQLKRLPAPPGEYTYVGAVQLPTGGIFMVCRRKLPGRIYQLYSCVFMPSGDSGDLILEYECILVEAAAVSYVNWHHRVALSPDGKIYVSSKFWPNLLTEHEAATIAQSDRKKWCRLGRCIYWDVPYFFQTLFMSDSAGRSFSYLNCDPPVVSAPSG